MQASEYVDDVDMADDFLMPDVPTVSIVTSVPMSSHALVISEPSTPFAGPSTSSVGYHPSASEEAEFRAERSVPNLGVYQRLIYGIIRLP